MNKNELIELLSELASLDLVEGENIEDHPASVAIRAINQCFEDIKEREKVIEGLSGGLIPNVPYHPEW